MNILRTLFSRCLPLHRPSRATDSKPDEELPIPTLSNLASSRRSDDPDRVENLTLRSQIIAPLITPSSSSSKPEPSVQPPPPPPNFGTSELQTDLLGVVIPPPPSYAIPSCYLNSEPILDVSTGLFQDGFSSRWGGYAANILKSFEDLASTTPSLPTRISSPEFLETIDQAFLLADFQAHCIHNTMDHPLTADMALDHAIFSRLLANKPVLIPILNHSNSEAQSSFGYFRINHVVYLLIDPSNTYGILGNRGGGHRFQPHAANGSGKIGPLLIPNIKDRLLSGEGRELLLKLFTGTVHENELFDFLKKDLLESKDPTLPILDSAFQSPQKSGTCYLHGFRHILASLLPRDDYNTVMTEWRAHSIRSLMQAYQDPSASIDSKQKLKSEMRRVSSILSRHLASGDEKYFSLKESLEDLDSFIADEDRKEAEINYKFFEFTKDPTIEMFTQFSKELPDKLLSFLTTISPNLHIFRQFLYSGLTEYLASGQSEDDAPFEDLHLPIKSEVLNQLLIMACLKGSFDTVQYLVTHGATPTDIPLIDSNGLNTLKAAEIASTKGHPEIMAYIQGLSGSPL